MAKISKIGIIIKREYTTRVLKKSFLFFSIFAPILLVVISALPALLMEYGGEDTQVVAVIDKTGEYAPLFESNEDYKFVVADKSLSEYQSEGTEGEVKAILQITQSLEEDPQAITLFSFKTLPSGLENYINARLSAYLSDKKLASHNIPNLKQIVQSSKVKINIATYKWGEDGAEVVSSGDVASGIGMALTFISYMFIMIYGMMVTQGVLEEKKNRILEVIVSSVKPFELMMGKIVGIGLVGLTQLAIWIGIGSLISFAFPFIASAFMDGTTSDMVAQGATNDVDLNQFIAVLNSINFAEILTMFVLFFIGGYLLYAALCATLASTVSSEEDSGQMMTIITVLMMAAMYIGMAATKSPESALTLWSSFIPFTSPVVMMVRIPYDVPLWQELVSLLILFASSVGIVYIGAKIYRVGILMYGKKASFKEIWRWINYK